MLKKYTGGAPKDLGRMLIGDKSWMYAHDKPNSTKIVRARSTLKQMVELVCDLPYNRQWAPNDFLL